MRVPQIAHSVHRTIRTEIRIGGALSVKGDFAGNSAACFVGDRRLKIARTRQSELPIIPPSGRTHGEVLLRPPQRSDEALVIARWHLDRELPFLVGLSRTNGYVAGVDPNHRVGNWP